MKNSMASLSERVQQQLKDDQQAVSDQTARLLQQHEEGLSKLSKGALITTKAVLDEHNVEMGKLHDLTLRRLRWLMFWPLLTSLFVSLLMMLSAAAWSWVTLNQMNDQVLQKQEQIKQIEATFCASQVGLKICKKG